MKFENVSFGKGISNYKGKQINNVVIQNSNVKGDIYNNVEINQNNVDADNNLNLGIDDDFFNDIFGDDDDDVDTNKTAHNVVNVRNSGEETIVIVNGKKIVINAKGEVIQ